MQPLRLAISKDCSAFILPLLSYLPVLLLLVCKTLCTSNISIDHNYTLHTTRPMQPYFSDCLTLRVQQHHLSKHQNTHPTIQCHTPEYLESSTTSNFTFTIIIFEIQCI
jgi:hypothetical protein